VVALAAELRRRGYRIASLKHGHHDFEMDQPGRDTWRHFHEGGVEAVVMTSARKVALVMRLDDGEPDPRDLIRRFYSGRGYDLVLVEGYKRGPFPRIEVFRSTLHDRPLHDPAASIEGIPSADAGSVDVDSTDASSTDGSSADAGSVDVRPGATKAQSMEPRSTDVAWTDSAAVDGCIAMVTDAADLDAPWPVIALDADDPLAGAHVAAVADLVERRFLGGCDGG
jgi:molybdopterin-guanine dinucleotide biosynthesis protein MobB